MLNSSEKTLSSANARDSVIHAVVGIIKKENKILIAERQPDKSYAGYWEFPGGKIEENEKPEDALKRELFEELGIKVLQAEFWFETSHAYPDKIVLLSVWMVHEYAEELYSKEKQILRWATLSEISTKRILEGNHLIIERLSIS